MMEQKTFCVKTYHEFKYFKIVQTKYRREFNFNAILNQNLIINLVTNFEAHGTYEDRKPTGSSSSRPPITI